MAKRRRKDEPAEIRYYIPAEDWPNQKWTLIRHGRSTLPFIADVAAGEVEQLLDEMIREEPLSQDAFAQDLWCRWDTYRSLSPAQRFHCFRIVMVGLGMYLRRADAAELAAWIRDNKKNIKGVEYL